MVPISSAASKYRHVGVAEHVLYGRAHTSQDSQANSSQDRVDGFLLEQVLLLFSRLRMHKRYAICPLFNFAKITRSV
jgi:hypothetical protein